jgi:hypothetical protein
MRARLLMLALLGVLAALSETYVPGIIGVVFPPLDVVHIVVGLIAVYLALTLAGRVGALPWERPAATIGVAAVLCLVAGGLGGVWWPNSGDEYSDVFLADTLLAGRLWNPTPADPWLFETSHVLVHEGQTFSPYPPGWPALLAPFRALHGEFAANLLLTLLLGVAVLGACRRLKVGPPVANAALCLVLLTPFTLFLGASLLPQTMTAALVACVVWVQLADEERPSPGYKLLIGALFGWLLLTRYEVLPLVALPYAIDRLVRRRRGALGEGMVVMLGLLPFVLCFAAYNAGITGDPLHLTANFVGPVTPGSLAETQLKAFPDPGAWRREVYWLGGLAQFGGFPVLVLAAIALVAKCRARACRFYDLLLPIAIIAYAFVPFTGGHQYGPRYWFWAWPPAVLTVTSGLLDGSGRLRLFGSRPNFTGFAAACLAYAGSAFCVLLVTTHAYIAARRAVYDVAPAPMRSVVLVPARWVMVWPWQIGPILFPPNEFTRNGIGFDGPTLYGQGALDDAEARACRLSGRAVFRWQEPGRLEPVDCREARPPVSP